MKREETGERVSLGKVIQKGRRRSIKSERG